MKGVSAGALALAVVSVALNGQAPAPPQPVLHVGRSKIATKYGIVAASQPLAARAGVQVLERGGNAVDAAIAANAVMGLVEPHYERHRRRPLRDLLRGEDRQAARPQRRRLGADRPDAGAAASRRASTRMPSSGIHTRDRARRRRRLGRAARAVRQAADVAICWRRRSSTPRTDFRSPTSSPTRWAARDDEARRRAARRRRRSCPDGRAPSAGEVFKNPRSRRLAAADRRARAAPASTRARPPKRSSPSRREQGGTMTAADLTEFQPEWVEPISTTYRGWTVYELPPNTQGIAALMMLNLMEQFPLGEYGFHSTKALHVMIEAKKLAYADMLRYVADPKFSKVPVAAMLSKDAREAARAR